MKKLLILVIVILMLFTGCATKAPVSPEPEAEQPVQTEQPPVEEQPAGPPEASPEEPPELTVPPVDYTAFCGHYSDTETVEGPCYTVSILGVDNETGEIELSISYVGVNSSPVYTTDPIRASIESDHTVAFDWKDSWKNQGVGTLILDPGDPSSVQLMMTVTEEAEFNRATLSTREQYKTLTRRVLSEPELPELYPYEEDYFIFSQIGWNMEFVIPLDWQGRVTVLTSASEEPVQVLRVVPNQLLEDPSYSGEFCIQTIGVPKEEYAGSYYEQKVEQGKATLLHESLEHVYLLETSASGMPGMEFCVKPEDAEKLIWFDATIPEEAPENPTPQEQALLDSELVNFDSHRIYRYTGNSRVIKPVGWDVALELPEKWVGKVTVLTTHPCYDQHNYFIIPNVVLEAYITELDRAPMNSYMDYCVRLVGQLTDALYPPSETARVIHSDSEFTYYLDTNISRSPESQENRVVQQLVQKIGEAHYAELIEDFRIFQKDAKELFTAEGGLHIIMPEIPENIDEETARILERVYAMDFSELELGADKALLLDFLTVALTDETSLNDWNKLGNDWDAIYRFYDIKNTIITFLEELEQDPDLKALFWQMEQWKINQKSGVRYSISGVDSDGREWDAYVIPGIGVDMEDYVTPSRKRLQTLSETGENSELVSEEVREEFVTFALRECWYGREVAGKYSTAQWIWHVSEEGDVLLEARHYPGGEVMEHHKRPYNIIYLKKSEGAVYLLNYVDQSNDLPDV